MMAVGHFDHLSRKAMRGPGRPKFARLALQLRQLGRTVGDDQLGSTRRQIQQRAVAPRLFRVEAKLVVEIAKADGLPVEKAADGETTCD